MRIIKKSLRNNRGLLLTAALAVFVPCLALALYCTALADRIEERFAGRRWSMPSTVYSDGMLLYPGQRVNVELLDGKLSRLGYRTVAKQPRRRGEMRKAESSVEIYLHDFDGATLKREGFPVRIEFSGGIVTAITRSASGEAVTLLELEPEVLMRFFGPEREQRILVSIEEVPLHVRRAVMAAEDARFEKHHGFDPRSILRALSANLRYGAVRQGGSTITQQLAKNYFLTPERSLSRKFRELLFALTMELSYGKDEILEIYLNEIYFGQKGSVAVSGIGEAAAFYFNRTVGELTLSEGAVIAGLIKGPNSYSPYVDAAKSRRRRDEVLRAMVRHGWIEGEDFARAAAAPVEPRGYRVYGKRAPYFMDYLSRQLTELYSTGDLESLGLDIFTTLDTTVQEAAEKALEEGLARLEKNNHSLTGEDASERIQGAVIVMQPKTGYILAMAGGRDYGASPFNRVTQARRQPGSAFKPFVYLAGLDAFTPASKLSNETVSYDNDGTPWTPRNYRPLDEKNMSLRRALAISANIPTVDLAMKTGLDHVIATAKGFGFSTPLIPFPSLALGSFEVIPIELARAYSALAADGLLPWPMSLRDVADENGDILERRYLQVERATTREKAFLVSSMLRTAVEEGTGRPLGALGIDFPVAGKTGTTSGFRDAWFVGYTPEFLALVWVGFDDGSSIDAGGAAAALPIWASLARKIPRYTSGDWFRTPPGIVRKVICSESGRLAIRFRCPEPMEEFFPDERAPSEECGIHRDFLPLKKIIEGLRGVFERQ